MRCAEWLQRREINVAPVVVSRSVGAVARDIRVHPVREYLNRLHWDGTPRLEGWTVTHLGAEDTPLNRAFGSLWMISAVARIMQPGSKADHMLILEGPQGAKKSTALTVLAGDGWFTDELAEIGSKDAALQMRGVWIIEIAELDAIGRAEVSRIKAFLSRTVDRYRPPYDRYVVDVPRQCVFAGSVNPDTYLRDETGNRRFWPVRCGRIDLDALRRDRDQLWAEAVVRYREGAIWWIDDRDLIAAANAEQEARVQADAWDALIERWLVFEKRRVNRGYAGFDDWQTEEIERSSPIVDVSVGEILEQAIGIEPARWTKSDQMRVGAYLKTKGWKRYNARIGSRADRRSRMATSAVTQSARLRFVRAPRWRPFLCGRWVPLGSTWVPPRRQGGTQNHCIFSAAYTLGSTGCHFPPRREILHRKYISLHRAWTSSLRMLRNRWNPGIRWNPAPLIN